MVKEKIKLQKKTKNIACSMIVVHYLQLIRTSEIVDAIILFTKHILSKVKNDNNKMYIESSAYMHI